MNHIEKFFKSVDGRVNSEPILNSRPPMSNHWASHKCQLISKNLCRHWYYSYKIIPYYLSTFPVCSYMLQYNEPDMLCIKYARPGKPYPEGTIDALNILVYGSNRIKIVRGPSVEGGEDTLIGESLTNDNKIDTYIKEWINRV